MAQRRDRRPVDPVGDRDIRDWDEDDWELFMRKAEVRSARYQELIETLIDHPNRDEIIAREMGWGNIFEECGSEAESCEECQHRGTCRVYEMNRVCASMEAAQSSAVTSREFELVRKIPAYRKGHDFCLRLHNYINKHYRVEGEPDEDLMMALSAAHLIPAKIAGGHGMGYGRDCLCGNIANCKRAMKNADACIAALEDMKAKKLLPEAHLDKFIKQARAIREEVANWIEELRSRVWWR